MKACDSGRGAVTRPKATHHLLFKVEGGTMKPLRENIRYTFERTPTGARVVIKTTDTSALDAIYAFLRYQVREQETGALETIN
jgi:hypothetical protein